MLFYIIQTFLFALIVVFIFICMSFWVDAFANRFKVRQEQRHAVASAAVTRRVLSANVAASTNAQAKEARQLVQPRGGGSSHRTWPRRLA